MTASTERNTTGAGRIGFLFNHDQIHQIAHSLPIALALCQRDGPEEIVVVTTNSRLSHEVRRLGGPAIGTRITLAELDLRAGTAVLDRAFGKVIPLRKIMIYRDNIAFFRSLDWLVVAEKTSLLLKTRLGLTELSMIHTRHGAGDRAIGFDRASAGFDHVLCSGPKIRRRLLQEAQLDPARVSIVGYPKFDLPQPPATLPEGFDPRKPTVVYNPHPSPHLSSWFREGRAVLDFFLHHPGYQLIFAPHVMLFQRHLVLTIDKLRLSRPGRIDPKYHAAPNIHIDLGSRASTDMTYTAMADIYLGDVSSQVYEFLRRPRPCIFLNAQAVRWQADANYLHWQAGEVIDSASALPEALARAEAEHAARYRKVQDALFQDSFDLTAEPSSQRAARVIAGLIDRRRRADPQ